MPKETLVLHSMRCYIVTGELAPGWPSYAHNALSDMRSQQYDYGKKYKYLLGMFFFLLENDAFLLYLPQILSAFCHQAAKKILSTKRRNQQKQTTRFWCFYREGSGYAASSEAA